MATILVGCPSDVDAMDMNWREMCVPVTCQRQADAGMGTTSLSLLAPDLASPPRSPGVLYPAIGGCSQLRLQPGLEKSAPEQSVHMLTMFQLQQLHGPEILNSRVNVCTRGCWGKRQRGACSGGTPTGPWLFWPCCGHPVPWWELSTVGLTLGREPHTGLRPCCLPSLTPQTAAELVSRAGRLYTRK